MGIDYGLGQTNIDKATGIRYGVISQNECIQAWSDGSEAEYGEPHCPKCGNEVGESTTGFDYEAECGLHYCEECDDVSYPMEVDNDGEVDDACPECGNPTEKVGPYKQDGCGEYVCHRCHYLFDDCYGDEPLGYTLDDGEDKASAGSDGDIFILESPYYTLCDFCSPCAPGAGYLTSEGSVKAYCFGHDWFYDHPEHPKVAPYTVYRVSDDSIVEPESK